MEWGRKGRVDRSGEERVPEGEEKGEQRGVRLAERIKYR
jgi:hypothetical protein